MSNTKNPTDHKTTNHFQNPFPDHKKPAWRTKSQPMMMKTGAWASVYHYSARVGSRHKKQQAANRNDINTDFVTFSAQDAAPGTGSAMADEAEDE
ncbi:hypothetical protein [Aeromonas sp. XH]|uniref:hypothetical protein n=1 Tax=Aeromonas TaxID=642 RepID=UPI0029664412|nr:hypothetical protein [Aeromonas sp. XH]WOX46969.1 hypothetical protein R2B70_12085 [Aeromonas sp. XH]